MLPLESVPNVSEGRDVSIVASIGLRFAGFGASLVDRHLDPDHDRTVFTLLGDERSLEDGLVAGVAEASRSIDLRRHDGIHPRVGAADVVPVVPLAGEDLERAEAVARAVARRIGNELGLSVFLYGTLCEGRRPAFYRRGGPAALERRVESGELEPAHGPRELDPRAGAVLVGVRAPLLAFNVVLDGGSLDDAREVAAAVRESSGGLPGVQALGLLLRGGAVQVSTNILDLGATPPHLLVQRIVEEAGARGARVGAGELVGLVPAAGVAAAAAAAGVDEPLDARGVPTADALTAAARMLRLEQLDPDRVIEWHVEQ